MYSRKALRPALSGQPEQSIADRPLPPPDYAGIAFRPSEARTQQDFPETHIANAEPVGQPSRSFDTEVPYLPALHELALDEADSLDSLDDSDNSNGSDNSDRSEFSNSLEVSAPSEGLLEPSEDEHFPLTEEKIESPLPPSPQAAETAEVNVPAESIAPTAPASSSQPPHEAEPTTDAPSLNWLREMKIEDMLMLWLLMQLLSGESRDEIYLLLGLLLFSGR